MPAILPPDTWPPELSPPRFTAVYLTTGDLTKNVKTDTLPEIDLFKRRITTTSYNQRHVKYTCCSVHAHESPRFKSICFWSRLIGAQRILWATPDKNSDTCLRPEVTSWHKAFSWVCSWALLFSSTCVAKDMRFFSSVLNFQTQLLNYLHIFLHFY